MTFQIWPPICILSMQTLLLVVTWQLAWRANLMMSFSTHSCTASGPKTLMKTTPSCDSIIDMDWGSNSPLILINLKILVSRLYLNFLQSYCDFWLEMTEEIAKKAIFMVSRLNLNFYRVIALVLRKLPKYPKKCQFFKILFLKYFEFFFKTEICKNLQKHAKSQEIDLEIQFLTTNPNSKITYLNSCLSTLAKLSQQWLPASFFTLKFSAWLG